MSIWEGGSLASGTKSLSTPGALFTSEKVVGYFDSSVDPLEGATAYSWVLTNAEETGAVIRTEPTKTAQMT